MQQLSLADIFGFLIQQHIKCEENLRGYPKELSPFCLEKYTYTYIVFFVVNICNEKHLSCLTRKPVFLSERVLDI